MTGNAFLWKLFLKLLLTFTCHLSSSLCLGFYFYLQTIIVKEAGTQRQLIKCSNRPVWFYQQVNFAAVFTDSKKHIHTYIYTFCFQVFQVKSGSRIKSFITKPCFIRTTQWSDPDQQFITQHNYANTEHDKHETQTVTHLPCKLLNIQSPSILDTVTTGDDFQEVIEPLHQHTMNKLRVLFADQILQQSVWCIIGTHQKSFSETFSFMEASLSFPLAVWETPSTVAVTETQKHLKHIDKLLIPFYPEELVKCCLLKILAWYGCMPVINWHKCTHWLLLSKELFTPVRKLLLGTGQLKYSCQKLITGVVLQLNVMKLVAPQQ